MRDRFPKPLLIMFLLLAATVTASARTFPLEKIAKGTQEFIGAVSYDVEKAYAGNHNLEVTVSLSTKGTTNLELVKFEPPEQARIRFTEISKVETADAVTGLLTTEYKYLVDIADDVEPRIHVVTMFLGYPGDKNVSRAFWLYVGAKKKGKLGFVSGAKTEFFTGILNKYSVELENNFPDYPANIRSITIKSDPAGLVENTTVQPENLVIDSFGRGSFDVSLKAAPMGFTNLFSGLSKSPELVVQVTYDDGYGRVVTDLNRVELKLRPRDRFLIIAMLIGVVVGAIIKCYLQRLQQQGVITRHEVLIAVSITSLIGLVVSFVALVGKIQIVAFQQTGSYDNPAVIFVISLAAAVGGAQLLSTFFKAVGQSSSAGSAATGSTATATPSAKPAS